MSLAETSFTYENKAWECALLPYRIIVCKVDLSRFDSAPLIAFTATKETDYGTETNRRI